MSWSSAGPRGPAVWMFVLSTTGVPVAWASGGILSGMTASRERTVANRSASRGGHCKIWCRDERGHPGDYLTTLICNEESFCDFAPFRRVLVLSLLYIAARRASGRLGGGGTTIGKGWGRGK